MPPTLRILLPSGRTFSLTHKQEFLNFLADEERHEERDAAADGGETEALVKAQNYSSGGRDQKP